MLLKNGCFVLFFTLFSNSLWALEFKIDEDSSFIHVITGRAGALKALSHFHLIVLKPLTGNIAFNSLGTSTAKLSLLPQKFQVDLPVETTLYPDIWSKNVSPKAAKGTRKNMLGKKLLSAQAFPEITVEIEVDTSSFENNTPKNINFQVLIDVKGNEIYFDLPGTLIVQENKLIAQFEFEINHQQLGLKPFKAAGGAIAVAEGMSFRVYIEAILNK